MPAPGTVPPPEEVRASGAAEVGTLNVLIVDDDRTVRLILNRLLTKAGHHTRVADCGETALELFDAETPDIVLLDVMMPGLSGWEVAREIRARKTRSYVPIIFMTALEDERQLGRCFEAGGDEVLHKPVSENILHARLATLQRLRTMSKELEVRSEQIEAHRQRLMHEQDVARRVFDKILASSGSDDPNVRAELSPMAMFNGDLVLSAYLPPATTRVLVGDFTGHGLPAAVGAVPLTEIFHSLTARGCSLGELISKLNARLSTILPRGIFCATCVMEIDPFQGVLRIWNGGLPDAFLRRADGGALEPIPSRHPALGILPGKRLKTTPEIFQITPGDRVFLATDGLSEATNPQGEPYGEERFRSRLAQQERPTEIFDDLLADLAAFRVGGEQDDDITLVQVTCPERPELAQQPAEGGRDGSPGAMPWRFTIDLDSITLAQLNPLPLLLDLVTRIQGLGQHRSQVFTILTELYLNALDHGLLGLDSSLKATPAGFARYFQQREEALAALRAGRIRIDLEHSATPRGGRLGIRVEDSGPGFDHAAPPAELEGNRGHCSRGIALVRELCERVEYIGTGNVVEAVYLWR